MRYRAAIAMACSAASLIVVQACVGSEPAIAPPSDAGVAPQELPDRVETPLVDGGDGDRDTGTARDGAPDAGACSPVFNTIFDTLDSWTLFKNTTSDADCTFTNGLTCILTAPASGDGFNVVYRSLTPSPGFYRWVYTVTFTEAPSPSASGDGWLIVSQAKLANANNVQIRAFASATKVQYYIADVSTPVASSTLLGEAKLGTAATVTMELETGAARAWIDNETPKRIAVTGGNSEGVLQLGPYINIDPRLTKVSVRYPSTRLDLCSGALPP